MSPAFLSLRGQFPALTRCHNGHPVAYFDGPGGTQCPHSVAEAVSNYLLHHNANTHRAFPTDQLLAEARRRLALFVNGRPEEIVFGNNMIRGPVDIRLAEEEGL